MKNRYSNTNTSTSTEAVGLKLRLWCVCVQLQLWDTAGQERFRKSMVPHYYRNAHAVVFVYDVTKPESFASLPAWISER